MIEVLTKIFRQLSEKTKVVISFVVLLSGLISFPAVSLAAQLDARPSYVLLNGEQFNFENRAIEIPAHARFAKDDMASWNPEDVFAGKYKADFFPINEKYGNFGFTEAAYWLSFEIDFENSVIGDELLLVINAPTLDEVSLFIQNESGDISEKRSGYRQPASSRDVDHHNFIFRLNPDQGGKFLLRAKTNTSLVIPLELWEEKNFQNKNYRDVVVIGIYLGILISMFFYNSFIYVSTREQPYLFYILFILCYGSLQATVDGLIGFWVWSEDVAFRGYDVMLVSSLTGILSILFSMSFLQTRQGLPKHHKVMIATIILLVLSTAASFATDGKGLRLTIYLSLWVTILLLIVGIAAVKAGQLGARYFMLAWMFLLIGTAAYLLCLMGFFNSMAVLTYSMKTGSSIEIILLSLGLADRFNRERRYKQRLEIEKNEMELRAQMLATVDTRTGMPNRAQLQQQIETYMANRRRFALVLMKVRGFKQINNTLGHENGDELLNLIALKIDSVINQGCGEECETLPAGVNIESLPSKVAVVDSLTFAIILSSYEDDSLEERAEQLKERVSGTIDFRNVILDIEMLLGLAENRNEGSKSADRLVHEAQVGLAAATKFERQIGIYTPLIDPYSEDKLSLMGNLRAAVSNEDLDLYFQPQFNLGDMSLTGFEALLRWQDRNGNHISPASFIPLAESSGVIKPLTRWVIREAAARLAEISSMGENLQVSINLSVSNLREDDLVKYIRSVISDFSIDPKCLKFEITESSMIENEEVALNRLLKLRRLGCQISIDDYGSGYASLGYLKQLPISEVKIDRAFIKDLSANEDDQVIVRSTISMCHDLGLRVVAEGIENEETLNILNEMGCNVGQGYLMGKPSPYSKGAVQVWLNEGAKSKEHTI